MRIGDIVDHLQSVDLGRPGVDLFEFFMPEGVAFGVVVRDSASGSKINHEIPGYYAHAGFQTVVRAKNYETGKALIEAVSRALTVSNVTIGEMRVNHIRPLHDPIVFPRSPGDLLEFSVNYEANYSLS